MLPKDAAPGDPPVRRGRAERHVRHPYWTPLRTTLRRLDGKSLAVNTPGETPETPYPLSCIASSPMRGLAEIRRMADRNVRSHGFGRI